MLLDTINFKNYKLNFTIKILKLTYSKRKFRNNNKKFTFGFSAIDNVKLLY